MIKHDKNSDTRRGFSLAEMMVVMLVVAIILAASAPMITRKVVHDRQRSLIFDMLDVDPTNAVEYVKGRNQRIFMNSRRDGYVGITEAGEKIPENSVLFGLNKFPSLLPTEKNLVGIGFNTQTGTGSVAIGYYAQGGENGVAIGYNARNIRVRHAMSSRRHQYDYNSVAVGYSANTKGYNATAIGYNAHAKTNSTAIGYNATAEHSNTVVLGTEKDTVYIPGNLVVNHSALIGLAAKGNDNLYFRPYAQEDGRHFAVFNAGDWKGEDSNLALVQDCLNTDWLGVKIGPFVAGNEWWRGDYGDNNRAHIHFTDSNACDTYHTYKHRSDLRLKNVGEPFTGGLEELNRLTFYNFTFKDDKKKTPQVGVMAQDLQKVFPAAVKTGDDGYLLIRWDEMFYAAINAIKEINSKVAALADNIQNIIKDVAELKSVAEKQQAVIDAQSKTLEEQQQKLDELYLKIEKSKRNK